MRITHVHTLRPNRRRAILDSNAPMWVTYGFKPYGMDVGSFVDPTIQWSPMMASLRSRYFKSMYPRADQRRKRNRVVRKTPGA